MKLLTAFRSLVLSAALVAPAFADQPSTTSEADPVVSLYSKPTIAKGMSRETVIFMLGIPGAKISPEVWVYWEFKMAGVPGSDSCDAIVIGFIGDRVNYLRLTRSEYVRAFIAHTQLKDLKTIVATK